MLEFIVWILVLICACLPGDFFLPPNAENSKIGICPSIGGKVDNENVPAS